MENSDDLPVVRAFCRMHRLSVRETELLRLAVLGLNNDEAAALLGCARATVATHWNRIFAKVGARGQRDVLATLVRWMANGDEIVGAR